MSTVTQVPTNLASLIPPGVTSIPTDVIASMASAMGMPEATLASMASAALATATATATGSAVSQPTSTPTAAGSSAMSSGLSYHGIHPYNVACLLFFAITGLILQVPVIYAHSGIVGPPNVPVIVMSSFYLYLMLSFIIGACYWHSENPTSWWNGAGWCDIDVRMTMAISIGIIATQCVINYNILDLLKTRPTLMSRNSAIKRNIIELCACLFLPVLNIAISTFYMSTRYFLSQDLGCSASIDASVATIIVFMMWFPILGVTCLFTLCWIIYRFYKRGNLALETIKFLPNMNSSQLFRMIGFAVIIAFILVPLSICTAVMNFISMHDAGIHAISWAHGKPQGWSNILRVTLLQMQADPDAMVYAVTVVNMIVHYVNIAIAWLLFICYGTGSVAISSYKVIFEKFWPVKNSKQTEDQLVDTYAESFGSFAKDTDSPSPSTPSLSKEKRSSFVITTTKLNKPPARSFPAPVVEERVDTSNTNMRQPRVRLGDFLKAETMNMK